uniref:Putative reverse transcriptase domain-containing protein n=1 Tax=Tanacetum cinerariifolium TaxID=118510 RepID=A0A699ISI9_TANCI|nr:putative reverse transcriptase domain-containing protein [Tanacetum cinerariifolium]
MRQRRWMELFSEYGCETKYHMGKENEVVDARSRKGGVKPRRVQDICDVRTLIMEEAHVMKYSVHSRVILESTDKVELIHEKLKAMRDRQKSYSDKRRKPLEFEVGDRDCLVAYRLRLPEELSSVHDTFHVSNLKKCLADANLHVPLDEIKVDKTLRFIEEPVEIMDREIKKLKRRKIVIVKVDGM